MAYDALVERVVAVPRSKVYEMVTDFGGVKKLLPDAVASCELTGEGIGCLRTIKLADGGGVVERLEVAHDDAIFAYSILENDALPVSDYFACVTLADAGDGKTHISWGSNWSPAGAPEDEVRTALEGLYTALIDGIEKAA